MYASPVFESSPQCKPSPNGKWIATLGASSVSIRSAKTLGILNVVELVTGSGSSSTLSPGSGSSSPATLLWAPSSTRFLVSTADQIDVYAAGRGSSYHAIIRNPLSLSVNGKHSIIQFGARDSEILVWPASGLKLVIFDLSTSKAVEIANPKFFQSPSASKGLSIRSETGHLALLSRIGGKDLVSLHAPTGRQVQRSWGPDTVDAQGLMWVPGGQSLLVWDSPIQGHRILIYSADGQHFRTIAAVNLLMEPSADLDLGVKLCQLSPNARTCAVGDHSRGIAIIETDSWRASLRLLHPTTIVPRDTLQVWQEQITPSPSFPEKRLIHTFIKATQPLSPPGLSTDGRASTDLRPGCSMAAFDASSTLLATRLDESPCTLWIWDIAAAELRAALIFHNAVAFQWHPTCRELLLVTCQDAAQHSMAFIWDPLSEGPTAIAPEDFLPSGKATGGGRTQVVWMHAIDPESPVMLLSDARHYLMLSLLSSAQGPGPWQQVDGEQWSDEDVEEARLGQTSTATATAARCDNDDEASDLDDTFVYKRVGKDTPS